MSKGRGCLPFPDGGSILLGQDLLFCVLPVILGIRRSAPPVGHFSAVSTGGVKSRYPERRRCITSTPQRMAASSPRKANAREHQTRASNVSR